MPVEINGSGDPTTSDGGEPTRSLLELWGSVGGAQYSGAPAISGPFWSGLYRAELTHGA